MITKSKPNPAALANIAYLAFYAYDRDHMTPTRRMDESMGKISMLNYHEVKDEEISRHLIDIHHCAVVRMERIERRALTLLREMNLIGRPTVHLNGTSKGELLKQTAR
jgi:hypothetical protein